MLDVINLALPFFGLIFLGFACGRLKTIPDSGLAWMDFFIIYVALPCLFYRIVAKTPLEELNNPSFVISTTLATYSAFALSFLIGIIFLRGEIKGSTLVGLAGAYGNIGYMGPGLALVTLGSAAAAPVALIFCFDNILLFSLLPSLMALAETGNKSFAASAFDVIKRIITHPLIVATLLGVLSAALRFEPPRALDRLMEFLQNAAAPCALFTLGVTVALRPISRVPWEVPCLVVIKLLVHPLLALVMLSLLGPFAESWVHTAVLLAALPPALNVFVFARQYGAWIEQASSAVLFGTLVSVVTVTAVMWMVKTHTLPIALFR